VTSLEASGNEPHLYQQESCLRRTSTSPGSENDRSNRWKQFKHTFAKSEGRVAYERTKPVHQFVVFTTGEHPSPVRRILRRSPLFQPEGRTHLQVVLRAAK
jgi:hypothetical protein